MRKANSFVLMISICLMFSGGFPLQAAEMTAEEIISEIHDRFLERGFRTMSYDEIRVSSYELSSPGKVGTMPLNAENATTMKLRYFYQAPNKHGYKLLSEPMDDYWVGSPNQPGAIPMDFDWKDKIMNWYSVTRADKEQKYRDRICYVVTLVPIPGMPSAYPMTWYVDKERFVIMKFMFLVKTGKKKVSTTGEVTYEMIKDYWFPTTAKWKTKITSVPYVFLSSSSFTNYNFNIPLDPSVFEEEFPQDWFKRLGETPLDERNK